MTTANRRRYARVNLGPWLTAGLPLFGAQVTWPNLETSDIRDLSYKGVAVQRPGLFPVAVHHTVSLQLQFGVLKGFAASAQVAWCTQDMVGLEVVTLSAEGHAILAEYLGARLVGARLRSVAHSFFARDQDFQFWFQDMTGVAVFVWTGDDRLVRRVVVDLGHTDIEWKRGEGAAPDTADRRTALYILSQMDKPGLPMEEFLRSLSHGV